jgi:hypothetical protein
MNGAAALVPLRLPEHGPVSGWPQRAAPDDPGRSRTDPDKASWRPAVDGDAVIRLLAAAVVLAVAAFAAIVSYSHIFELARHHGQGGTAARLLPLSVDGLIAAASLVMLHAARRKLDVPRLARAMLALGVGATVAANVGYGLPFGWLAAVVSAWPAVAFVGSVEMAVRFVRDARQDSPAADLPVVTPRHDSDHDKKGDRPQRKPVPARRGRPLTKQARAAAVIRDNPGLANAALARLAGCDVRTISRARNGAANKKGDHDD